MFRLSILPLTCALLIGSCESSTSPSPPKSESATTSPSTNQAAPNKAAPTTEPAAKQAPEMAAEAFYAEYMGEADAMKKIERYEKGITVTGATISSTQDTSTQVIAFAKFDDKRSLRMNFADKKAVEKGDTVSAKCQVNGDMNGEIFLAACIKK